MSDLVLFQPVRALDRNGVFAPGALARFYEPGTMELRTVYTTAALSIEHPTPLVANASGVFPPVYTSGLVKAVITDADGVTLPGGNMDPAFTIPASGAGADSITFAATAQIPHANVQDAIEGVDGNWRTAIAAIGLGITGSATLMANLDATGTASGVYRFDATTTGTRPSGWASGDDGAIFVIRQTATAAFMLGAARDDGILWARQMSASVWGAWYRLNAEALDQTAWNTGTATTEATITPAKLDAKIEDKVRTYASSSPVSFSAGGLSQWAHGLGGAPNSLMVILECTTADAGYSIGDRVYMGAGGSWGDTTQTINHGVYCDATNINIRWDDSATQLAVVANKGTGANSLVTPTSWRVYVTAQRYI